MSTEITHTNLLRKFEPLIQAEQEQLDPQDMPALGDVWTLSEPNIANARKAYGTLEISDSALYETMRLWLDLVQAHEQNARTPTKWQHLEAIAKKTALVVDFSAPGTYLKPKKNDRYKDKPYTEYWDRQRADAAAKIAIIAAGAKTGNNFSDVAQTPFLTGFEPTLSPRREEVHATIKDSGIQTWYYGVDEECKAIDAALSLPRGYMPRETVSINSGGISDTLTQVHQLGADLRSNLQTAKNPDGILTPGSFIVMPSHSQSLRMLCMMQRYNTIPESINLAIMPIATPKEGLKPYIQDEVSKTAYSVITRIADPRPADHMLLGG